MTRPLSRLLVRLRTGALAALSRADAVMNRLYGSRWNPLYHSGALVVVLFLVLLVTGVYLLLFYRVGSPWASVETITGQAWTGRWIRTLHRYASDAAIVAAGVHALRMFLQKRTWGARALAWVSGLVLLFVFLACGWTGYVMVWDVQAQVLAQEGARFLDALPIFSEPIGRAFTGERPLPGAFFFLNLFLHIVLPVGVGLILWIHVSRVSRPALLPPRGLAWGVTGLLVAVSVLWPLGMAERADLFTVPRGVPLDLFYAFWLPATRALPAWSVWLGGSVLGAAALLAPLWTRPREEARPRASVVNERFCTGCTQCALDCPYEAIRMVPRTGEEGRAELVARVDPALCASCGICAGSCAPMGVGPPGRTGRDQLERARAFLNERRPPAGEVILVACERSVAQAREGTFDGAPVLAVDCGGSLHTSVVELLVRSGAGGVMVVACPPRDCWNREGVKWLEQRMYEGREAELQERVDRERVRLAYVGAAEAGELARELARFRSRIRALESAGGEEEIELDTECDRPEPGSLPERVLG